MGKHSQSLDGDFIPYGPETLSSKRQSRTVTLGSWCKESPKGALFATDEKNLDKLVFLSYITLYKHLYWQMSCKKILEAFQIDLVWAAVFFL